jgi:hypothetical protein
MPQRVRSLIAFYGTNAIVPDMISRRDFYQDVPILL